MTEIIRAIESSAIRIKEALKVEDTSKAETTNESGDIQAKIDVISDEIIEGELLSLLSVKEIFSEEKESVVKGNEEGKYLVAYDPLDGSSLLDVNLSVGSIFAIYENSFEGLNIMAAAYVVYGPRVELVVARDNVEMFVLDEKNGRFVFEKEIVLHEKGKIIAPGGTQKEWTTLHREIIEGFFDEGYRLRYSGGLVPDLHHILLKGGGIHAYPASKSYPKGKLRLLFELFPFAFIFNKAGGLAVVDDQDLLEVTPEHPHDTSQCYFGSNKEIQTIIKRYVKEKNAV